VCRTLLSDIYFTRRAADLIQEILVLPRIRAEAIRRLVELGLNQKSAKSGNRDALRRTAPFCACGGNQALLASGGHQDFVAMQHVTDEYGTAEPDAVVPTMVGEERYTYRVWIHKNCRYYPAIVSFDAILSRGSSKSS
jgi:hypothetical protein